MTTRLKVLSGLLVLSIIYAAATTLIERREKNSRTPSMPRKAINTTNNSIKSEDETIVNKYKTFKIPPGNKKILTTWGRNPFVDTYKNNPKQKDNFSGIEKKSNNKTVHPVVLDHLLIESVALIGETKIVIINGQRYREGDLINNMFIEKINRNNITFRSGETKIIKSVGK